MSDDLDRRSLDLLVAIADRSIRAAVRDGRTWTPDLTEVPEVLRRPGAAFVTLHRLGRLRGCIGTLTAGRPLAWTVADRARSAALEDPRFPPLREHELDALDISVSVLGAPERLDVDGYDELVGALRPGTDGVLVEAGWSSATFLPAVWAELPDPERFVAALWQKAGLRPHAWPHDIRVSTYAAIEASGACSRG